MKTKIILSFLIVLLLCCAQAVSEERYFSIAVSDTEASQGDIVSWTIVPYGFAPGEQFRYEVGTVNDDFSFSYTYITDTITVEELNAEIVIRQEMLYSGETVLFAWYDEDDVYEESEPMVVTGIEQLSALVHVDKTDMEGEETVTLSIQPQGGVKDYKISVSFEFGSQIDQRPYPDLTAESQGEAVYLTQKLDFPETYRMGITVTDSNHASWEGYEEVYVISGTPAVDYDVLIPHYCWAGGETDYQITISGAYPPYHDLIFEITSDDQEILESFHLDICESGKSYTFHMRYPSSLSQEDDYIVGYRGSFYDSQGYRWNIDNVSAYSYVVDGAITLPDSLQEIGEEAFVGLKDLVIFIPSTVTYIADKAFGNNLIPCCEENS
ncbi:MAG: hypothetical protein IJ083_16690, partial [Clostridia bacterium]|nr:hypothetical protein [Clostridia bacterium]